MTKRKAELLPKALSPEALPCAGSLPWVEAMSRRVGTLPWVEAMSRLPCKPSRVSACLYAHYDETKWCFEVTSDKSYQKLVEFTVCHSNNFEPKDVVALLQSQFDNGVYDSLQLETNDGSCMNVGECRKVGTAKTKEQKEQSLKCPCAYLQIATDLTSFNIASDPVVADYITLMELRLYNVTNFGDVAKILISQFESGIYDAIRYESNDKEWSIGEYRNVAKTVKDYLYLKRVLGLN